MSDEPSNSNIWIGGFAVASQELTYLAPFRNFGTTMKLTLPVLILILSTGLSAQAQCSIDLPNDTVTLYYGYDPLACTTLQPVVTGASPTQLVWSTGSTSASITVCDTASSWYFVTLADDTACTSTDSVFVNVVDVRCGNSLNKVAVCHIPPGNPANAHTICISENGVPAHLAHGCHLGACVLPVDTSDVASEVEVTITPNPMTENAMITVRSGLDQRVRVRVIDALGRVHDTLLEGNMNTNETRTLPLAAGQLPSDASLVLIEVTGANERLSLPVLVER